MCASFCFEGETKILLPSGTSVQEGQSVCLSVCITDVWASSCIQARPQIRYSSP